MVFRLASSPEEGVYCVDLGESFHMSIHLQKSASIQARTSPPKLHYFNLIFPISENIDNSKQLIMYEGPYLTAWMTRGPLDGSCKRRLRGVLLSLSMLHCSFS